MRSSEVENTVGTSNVAADLIAADHTGSGMADSFTVARASDSNLQVKEAFSGVRDPEDDIPADASIDAADSAKTRLAVANSGLIAMSDANKVAVTSVEASSNEDDANTVVPDKVTPACVVARDSTKGRSKVFSTSAGKARTVVVAGSGVCKWGPSRGWVKTRNDDSENFPPPIADLGHSTSDLRCSAP